MNHQQQTRAWIDALVYDNSVIAKAIADNRYFDIQNQAQMRLQEIDIPNPRHEAWRYTDFKSLLGQQFISQDARLLDPRAELFDDWIYRDTESYRLVMLNGRFCEDLSLLPAPAKGVTVTGINQISEKQRRQMEASLVQANTFSDDIFDLINRALLQDGFYIQLGQGKSLQLPVEIVHLVTSSDRQLLAQPRSVLILEPSAEIQIIERFIGISDTQYFHNSQLHIQLQDNARLHHMRFQQESRQAHHLSRVQINQQRDSHYQLMNIATGAKWGRSDVHLSLEGENAECEMLGLYTVDDEQYNDIHLDVSHLAAHCQSELYFNGILLGAGRGVFDGRILVEQSAQKTDASMTNHNLVLSDHADIDTKPVLEIYADDVKCSHGATVGSIDPEQLFYCQSRGLTRHQALKLLCQGFANQVFEKLSDARLLEYAQNQVNAVLQKERHAA